MSPFGRLPMTRKTASTDVRQPGRRDSRARRFLQRERERWESELPPLSFCAARSDAMTRKRMEHSVIRDKTPFWGLSNSQLCLAAWLREMAVAFSAILRKLYNGWSLGQRETFRIKKKLDLDRVERAFGQKLRTRVALTNLKFERFDNRESIDEAEGMQINSQSVPLRKCSLPMRHLIRNQNKGYCLGSVESRFNRIIQFGYNALTRWWFNERNWVKTCIGAIFRILVCRTFVDLNAPRVSLDCEENQRGNSLKATIWNFSRNHLFSP